MDCIIRHLLEITEVNTVLVSSLSRSRNENVRDSHRPSIEQGRREGLPPTQLAIHLAGIRPDLDGERLWLDNPNLLAPTLEQHVTFDKNMLRPIRWRDDFNGEVRGAGQILVAGLTIQPLSVHKRDVGLY